MKRIQEKVKDLVEVRSYKSLRDFISDPEKTLTTYHFTDATSELMAKWIDRIVQIQPQTGAANAIAGYRGVGKSHFLALLGAIVSNPEFRSRINDAHVTASVLQLKSRKYHPVYVRRGTDETIFKELKNGVVAAFGIIFPEGEITLAEVLSVAQEKSADLPLIFLIDTAYDRAARVSREDGAFLGELAELAKCGNVFIGVALDDDITGADGINSAIASNYTIDYLDQEHLYRVVDANIFPKNYQAPQVLHNLYDEFRATMPGFKWSEQKFYSLYPLHPSIFEIGPYIRLYAPEFAMLGFASEAGVKVLGRPANSLVGLDEVFDRVETSLRKAADLQDAFKAYDALSSEVVDQIPIMQRLEAKLVLKALLLLSLTGEGATASEISASMLIYREDDVEGSVKRIEELLEKFAAALPDSINYYIEPGRGGKFSFKISEKDDLNQALSESAVNVSDEAAETLLHRFICERFQDCVNPPDAEQNENIYELSLNWKGSNRRGALIWNFNGTEEIKFNRERNKPFEWSVTIICEGKTVMLEQGLSELPPVIWQADRLKPSEVESFKRYYALLNDENLRNEFGSRIRAAAHSLQVACETAWNRIFIENGKFLIDAAEFPVTEKAAHNENLSDFLSEMLNPLFEKRFPLHPDFKKPISLSVVSAIISEYFGNAGVSSSEVRALVENYALPLGLVSLSSGNYILESEENLLNLPTVKEIISLLTTNTEVVSLKEIERILKAEPYGLPVQAGRLILAALVAIRKIEFVTSTGDRISRRSLDLKIIWDDIAGISLPAGNDLTDAELVKWASLLTGVGSLAENPGNPDPEEIKEALFKWLEEGKSDKVLSAFEKLPNELLNSKIVKYANHVKKAFNAAVSAAEGALGNRITLEDGLRRIAEAFLDSTEEFAVCSEKLITLENFVAGIELRLKVWDYVAICEKTGDKAIDDLQEAVLHALKQVEESPTGLNNLLLENVWQSFHKKFSEYFAAKHDFVMRSHMLQERFKKILQSEDWWEFENLSEIKFLPLKHYDRAVRLRKRFRELNCDFDVREMLKTNPFCACSFRLAQINDWEKLPDMLFKVISEGRKDYRKTLALTAETLMPLLEGFIHTERDGEFKEAAISLYSILESPQDLRILKNAELMVLRKAASLIHKSPVVRLNLPEIEGLTVKDELTKKLNRWFESVPNEPCLLKIEN